MLSSDSLKEISNIFCGDIADFYSYKKGYKLVEFFNTNFGTKDVYGSGFPSRWVYVHDKLVELINSHQIDKFFNIVLGKTYLMQEQSLSEVEAAEKIEAIYAEFNRIIHRDLCKITRNNGRYHLVKENDDLEPIGNGGFANVYRQKSTGLVVKKLKDDYLTDTGIRSRFKREYNITKSLQDAFGIIRVDTFDEGSSSYTMEYAETTLDKYVKSFDLSDDIKLNCIRQILHIMTEVHKRNIIHRDISANNIFVISGTIKIADFGLGKDLNVFTSHQTMHTNAVGQFYYCAPEQFMLLKDGDKFSDVYSLGRVINFIMTGDPRDSHHIYRNIAEKATNSDAAYRYADAGQLSIFFEKAVSYKQKGENQTRIDEKISRKVFDDEVESYIYDLSAEIISKAILHEKKGFVDVLLAFMKINDEHALHIIQSVDKTYRDVCGRTFATYDPFASFAYSVLRTGFSYVVNETAASILRFVARDINRFKAQHMIEDIKNIGVEPLIEEILDS
jgi:protein kinase domain protein